MASLLFRPPGLKVYRVKRTLCRLCGEEFNQTRATLEIFGNQKLPSNAEITIWEAIKETVDLQLENTDGLPTQMCRLCYQSLNNLYCFRRKCFSTQMKLLNATIPEKVFVKTESSIVSDIDDDDVQPNDMKQIEVYTIIEEDHHLQVKTEPIDAHDVLNINETKKSSIVVAEKNVVVKKEPLNVLDDDDQMDVPESQDNTSEQSGSYYYGHDTRGNDDGSSSDYFGDKEPTKKERKYNKTPATAVNRRGEYPCEYCGKFFSPWRLSFHLNSHFGLRPFDCTEPDCKRTFYSKHSLSLHMKTMHLAEPFECDICAFKTQYRTNLVCHMRFHQPPVLPCPYCDRLCYTTALLKTHIKTHTGERKFQCQVCSKTFGSRYNCRVHQRVHTKEKPYGCDKCPEQFGYNSLLKAHKSKYHA